MAYFIISFCSVCHCLMLTTGFLPLLYVHPLLVLQSPIMLTSSFSFHSVCHCFCVRCRLRSFPICLPCLPACELCMNGDCTYSCLCALLIVFSSVLTTCIFRLTRLRPLLFFSGISNEGCPLSSISWCVPLLLYPFGSKHFFSGVFLIALHLACVCVLYCHASG